MADAPSMIDVARMAQFESEVALLRAENDRLKQKLAPDIAKVTPELLQAGLLAWSDRAIENYNLTHPIGTDSITPDIVNMQSIALEPPSANQCQRLRTLFRSVITRSKMPPTQAEAIAMQAVLDTAKIGKDWLDFTRP